MQRLLVTGGGTGGHVYPALAVAQAFLASTPQGEVLFIGNQNRREASLIPSLGIHFEGLLFSGLPRKNPLALMPWGIQLLKAFLKAHQVLKTFRPHIVFAAGGYVTAPVLLAAKSLGIPCVVHEPDANPGLVNRTFAPLANATTCAFEAAIPKLKAKQAYATGNPLRAEIGTMAPDTAFQVLPQGLDPSRPILLVTGGSQGAKQINTAVIEALPKLLDAGIQVIHQTGESQYAGVLEALGGPPPPGYYPMAFITEMGAALAVSTLAVARAGSMTLSEMAQSRVPTILVPYPFAAADHQRKNAYAAEDLGMSKVIEDDTLTGATLQEAVLGILRHPQTLAQMKDATQHLARPTATSEILTILTHLSQAP